jgi:hypothetical protein
MSRDAAAAAARQPDTFVRGWSSMSRSIRWTEAMIVAALRDWVERYGEEPLRVDWDRHMCWRRGHAGKLARLQAHPRPVPSPTAVLPRFGTWEAALAAAGLQARSGRTGSAPRTGVGR